MKNILIVTQYFYPENFIVNSLANSLADKDCKIHVYTGYPTYPEKSHFQKNIPIDYSKLNKNIKIHRFPIFLRRKGKIFLSIHYISYLIMGIICSYKIFRLKIKWNSIFIFQTSPITVILIGAWIKIFTNSRLISWVQDLWPDSVYSHFYSSTNKYPFNKIVRKFINWICFRIYSLSDIILAQSVSYKDNLISELKDKNVELVFNTINDDNLDSNIEKEISRDSQKLNIISAGNFSTTIPYKIFIRAISVLKKEYGNKITWNFYGDGTQFSYFKREVAVNNLDDVVYLQGRVNQELLPQIMSKNDLFILGLIDEPLVSKTCPSRLIYAMANGMPIIASARGEIMRIVLDSKCGLVSNPDSYEELVINIKKFIDMKYDQKKRISENSRSYYNQNFSRAKVFEKIYNIL